MLFSQGRLLERVNAAFIGFTHPAAHREMKWDLARAGWVKDYLHCVEGAARCALIECLLQR